MGYKTNNFHTFQRPKQNIKSFTQPSGLITSFMPDHLPAFHQDNHKLFSLRTLKLFNIPSFPNPYYSLYQFKNLKYTNNNLRMWKEL